MQRRSELRHTAMDNGLAFLFDANRVEGTRSVLSGTARKHDYTEIRTALERWRRTTRPAVEGNLKAFENEYSPLWAGLDDLRTRMSDNDWRRLAIRHLAEVHAREGIPAFVARVHSVMSRFDEGLEAVADGRMTVEELGRIHAEMVDAYRAP